MKHSFPPKPKNLVVLIALVVSVCGWRSASADVVLISNGSFEDNPGASQSTPTGYIDSTTYTDWRVFNVSGDASFTSLETNFAHTGSWALQLNVTKTGATGLSEGGPYNLDRAGAGTANLLPVTFGASYNFTFYAAFLSGSSDASLNLDLEELNAAGGIIATNNNTINLVTSDNAYHEYTINWTPTLADTAYLNPKMALAALATSGNYSIALDDVQFGSVPEPGTVLLVGIGAAVLVFARRRRSA